MDDDDDDDGGSILRNGNVYRDGKVHVCAKQCPNCIFHPGNRFHLNPGRLEDMIAGAHNVDALGSAIVCHDTLEGDNAVCRGFFDKHPTPVLQIADRMGFVRYVPVAKKKKGAKRGNGPSRH